MRCFPPTRGHLPAQDFTQANQLVLVLLDTQKEQRKLRKMSGVLEYDSNNSGGDWWLSDDDWQALELAGWDVQWKKDNTSGFFHVDNEGRWLGALATRATLQCESADEGIASWSSVVKQNPDEMGCGCCGPPHSFSWVDDSGQHSYRSVEIVETAGVWS